MGWDGMGWSEPAQPSPAVDVKLNGWGTAPRMYGCIAKHAANRKLERKKKGALSLGDGW